MLSSIRNPSDLSPGSMIWSPYHCYQVDKYLASGVYGNVMECRNLKAHRPAVLKVLKTNNPEPWKDELDILQILAQHQGHRNHMVKWFHSFHISGTYIHEFEKLDLSLLQYVNQSPCGSLGLMEIRPILSQMAQALRFLKHLGIMHNDLKLDNVMMVDHLKKPLTVKLIDFGLASTENCQGKELHSTHFRAPEVFLGAPVDSSADMWALGIIAVSMYMGRKPLPGLSDEDMMSHIVETVGHCPGSVLDSGLYTTMYYGLSKSGAWESNMPSLDPKRRVLTRLDDIHTRGRPGRPFASIEVRDRDAFVHLVKKMLDPNPATRITPTEMMSHSFVSMRHLVMGNEHYRQCSHSIMYKADCIIKKKAPSNCSASSQSVPVSVPEKRKRTETQDNAESTGKRRRILESTSEKKKPDTTFVEANLPAPKGAQERTGRTYWKTAGPPATKRTHSERDQQRPLEKRVRREASHVDYPPSKSTKKRTHSERDQQSPLEKRVRREASHVDYPSSKSTKRTHSEMDQQRPLEKRVRREASHVDYPSSKSTKRTHSERDQQRPLEKRVRREASLVDYPSSKSTKTRTHRHWDRQRNFRQKMKVTSTMAHASLSRPSI